MSCSSAWTTSLYYCNGIATDSRSFLNIQKLLFGLHHWKDITINVYPILAQTFEYDVKYDITRG